MSSYFSDTPQAETYPADPYAADFPDAPRSEEGLRRPSIMVIDDSAAVRTVIQIAFRRVGVEVTAFEDGISAIKALTREEAPVPSVLLLDLGLPRMNGYEVATLLR